MFDIIRRWVYQSAVWIFGFVVVIVSDLIVQQIAGGRDHAFPPGHVAVRWLISTVTVELRERQQSYAGGTLFVFTYDTFATDSVHRYGVGRWTLPLRLQADDGRHARFGFHVHFELDRVVVRGCSGRKSQIEIRVAASAARHLVFSGPVVMHDVGRPHAMNTLFSPSLSHTHTLSFSFCHTRNATTAQMAAAVHTRTHTTHVNQQATHYWAGLGRLQRAHCHRKPSLHWIVNTETAEPSHERATGNTRHHLFISDVLNTLRSRRRRSVPPAYTYCRRRATTVA